MKPYAILWPTFALIALTFVVLFWVFASRGARLRRSPPAAGDFAGAEATARYFQPVELPGHNLRNLFELPVLYYALVPLLIVLHQASRAQIALAWAFVALRIVHSIAHFVVPKVAVRAVAFWLAAVVLTAMWIGFFVDIVAAANTVDPYMVMAGPAAFTA